MLVTRARLAKGESILIPGGAGGIGYLSIQVAKMLGAFVYTTAKKSMHQQLRKLGADVVIDHSEHSYIDDVLMHTGGKGVDVMVGQYTLSEAPRALRYVWKDSYLGRYLFTAKSALGMEKKCHLSFCVHPAA